jgi:hypothetical protein
MSRAGVVAVLAYFIALPATGEVFKCVEDGKTVFQDRPCSAAGVAITVTPANRTNVPESEPGKAPAEPRSLTKLREHTQSMELERRQREIAYAIRDSEQEIDGYRTQMDRELAALQYKKSQANNNLAGATWEQSISTEMQAVSEKYRTKIQIARDRIVDLRKRAADLGSPR